MSFEIKSEGVDVAAIMEAIRKRIEEKKKGLYTDEEIREIAEHRLDAVLDAHDFNPDLIKDFRAQPERWNFLFDPETIYRSSRGAVGAAPGRAPARAAAGPEALLEPEPDDLRALAAVRPEQLLRPPAAQPRPSS